MSENPKVKSVRPLANRHLLVDFTNGASKDYDCNQLIHLPAFEILKNDSFFKQVKADAGGYGISWNADVDLSEYEIWTNGRDLSEKTVTVL